MLLACRPFVSLRRMPNGAVCQGTLFGTDSKKATVALRLPAAPTLESAIKHRLGRKLYMQWPYVTHSR